MRLLAALMVIATNASASGFNLVWLAPESCATRPETAALVGDAAGRAEVQLREDRDGWLVTVIFFEPEEGVRRVKVPGCEEAVRTASLLVKLGSQGASPAPDEPKPVVEPPPPSPPILTVTEVAVTPPEPWHFSLAGGVALDVGSLPRVEPRFAVNANLTHGFLRMALDLRVGLPAKFSADITTQRAFEAQGAGCINFSWRALSGGPCLSGSVGSWNARASWGSGATVVATSLGAQLRGALLIVAGLELGALVGARFNVGRPIIVLGDTPVFATPRFTGDFQVTLGWRW